VVARDAPKPIVIDVDSTAPDLVTVDDLARLQLAAHRAGCSIQLRNASEALCELIALVGLVDVLPLEAGRESEVGEQLGVQEVVQPRDPAV
jgi:hypothetical protein